jgi:hypothetical protein
MAKKNVFWGILSIVLVFSFALIGCSNPSSSDDDDDASYPFVGVWTRDLGGGYTVNVTITKTEWAAKINGTLYNKGTYSNENPSTWHVTEVGPAGTGTAILGDTGIASITSGVMTVSSFADNNMNGTYNKN